MNYIDNEVLVARAAWTRLAEPREKLANTLINQFGPVVALRIATGTGHTDGLRQSVILEHEGMDDALARWAGRIGDLSPERDLDMFKRQYGGYLLVPEDDRWPQSLNVTGLEMPYALWMRGTHDLPDKTDAVSIVGSRDSTNYGNAVTNDLASAAVKFGKTVISGGAYGIDAQAHRSALAAEAYPNNAPTIAVMAGGVDRFYPAGNDNLLHTVAGRGLVLSEMPPGAAPTRWRFLARNRIIAALSCVTVVVEARWRSGSLNTANHAKDYGRTVAAVPGSVYSANSAGTHRLLHEGAKLVTQYDDVRQLYPAPVTR